MIALFAGVVAAVAVTAPPSTVRMSFEEILAKRVPGPEELDVTADLRQARRSLAGAGRFLSDPPTIAAAAGARRAETTQADVVLDLDLPLLARRESRGELEDTLGRAERLLPAAARLEAEAMLFGFYVEAWTAQERAVLRQEDAALVERWLEIGRRRAEAGATPLFETDLAESELGRARTLLAQAAWQWRMAWGDLRTRAAVPAEPLLVAAPPAPPARTTEQARALFATGTLRTAPAVRAELTAARMRLETARDASRWSLRPSVAREGDERVARFGLAWRMPRGGEVQALDRATDSEVARLDREARAALVLLETRFESALVAQRDLGGIAEFDSGRALAALEARLLEGKSELSEALSIRRQLLANREAALERAAALARAAYELHTLTTEVRP